MRFTSERVLTHDRTPNLASVWAKRNTATEARRVSIRADMARFTETFGRIPTIKEAYHHMTGRETGNARNYLICQWGVIKPESRFGLIGRMWAACGFSRD